jgi:hypothetical protein
MTTDQPLEAPSFRRRALYPATLLVAFYVLMIATALVFAVPPALHPGCDRDRDAAAAARRSLLVAEGPRAAIRGVDRIAALADRTVVCGTRRPPNGEVS